MLQPGRILSIALTLALSTILFPVRGQAGTWVAFGPKSYTRGTGAPVTVTDTFTLLNPATQYTLKAFNGGLDNTATELVSSSLVTLNGVQVLGPSNFSQNVLEVNVSISPQATNTLSVQVRGQPGGVLTIQVIGVDNDPPIISAAASTSPNAAGWYNSDVVVGFTCSDKTSGVASCPATITVGTEGANQNISGIATDLAGNTAGASLTVNLDKTPPIISATINPPPDAGGYNSTAVTVTFTCSDALSGVAVCPGPVQVTTEGAGQVVNGLGVDIAGNVGVTTVTVNISFSYFKIRSWQTGPAGNAASPSGKCLDYGISPTGSAGVFLNDCANANPVRVVELPRYTDAQGNNFDHEVLLYAGRRVIGVQLGGTTNTGGTSGTLTGQYGTEYLLDLQLPLGSVGGGNPINQIFRLDGDSIILEGTPASGSLPALRTPCINTVTTIPPQCPFPPPQLVIQVQNALGANGSPLVAAVRNLSDNEFWDFVPGASSPTYPTKGFVPPVATNYDLWNALCASPQATSAGPTVFSDPTQPTYGKPVPCGTYKAGWGSVISVTSPTDCKVVDPATGQTQDIGGCIDLSLYAPLAIPAGATIRGNRRGTNSGPQLYAGYTASRLPCEFCMIETAGDYARVTGLHLRGQSRSTDAVDSSLHPKTHGVEVEFPGFGVDFPLGGTAASLSTLTELNVTIDHNEASDWGDAAVSVSTPFDNSSKQANRCTYPGFYDSTGNQLYECDPFYQDVPWPACTPQPSCVQPNAITIAEDPFNSPGSGPLTNAHVARNYLHHNEHDSGGYGVAVGRAFVEGNTFLMNRHAITGAPDYHNEYLASSNLVLSSAPQYGLTINQDFDMHGTDQPTHFFGGAGGFYVEIFGNTFLGTNRSNYWLRGYPLHNTYWHGNVSLQSQASLTSNGNAVQARLCYLICNNSDFPIDISNDNQFSAPDPTSTLGVGDFDGDGDDDLFMATGAAWYYSPAGQREWRFLNSAPDTIDQLLFGDFDGDGRTDVVALHSGQLFVSWGGISAFEFLNSIPSPNCTVADMAVGDFNGVGRQTDIFCADWQNQNWWISYGGNMQFVMVNHSGIQRKDLRFGHFSICGGGQETDVFSVQSSGWQVSCGATGGWQPLPVSLTTNPASVDGLVVADFNGDGIADVGMACNSGGFFGIGSSPGWQISYGGAQGWSNCNAFASATNSLNCALNAVGLSSSCITLARGAVGRFSGGTGADILLWSSDNNIGGATFWDFPAGTGTPYQLSAQDVDMH